MNKIHLAPVSTTIPSSRRAPGVAILFRDTLNFCIQAACNQWCSPDDKILEMKVYALLSHPINVIIEVYTKNSKSKHYDDRFKSLRVDCNYSTDKVLSEFLTTDILGVLRRYGLSALYNETGKAIYVQIHR